MKKMFLIVVGLSLAIQSLVAQNGAGVVSISAPASVAPGATFTATIVMTNSGANAWTPGGPAGAGVYSLGSESPRNNSTWLAGGRIPLPSDPINPGDTATFTTTFTAPATPGIYSFAWGMVQELTQWFGEIASTTIRVGSGKFTSGHLVAWENVATGSDPLDFVARGSAIVVKDITTSGVTTFQVALPFTGPNALLANDSTFVGSLDLSTDKNYLVLAGFNTNLPHSVNLNTVNGVPRAVGTINAGGQFVIGAKADQTANVSSNAVRSGISDGLGNFWSGGVNNAGVYYYGTNSPAVQITPLDPTLSGSSGLGAIRVMKMVNGRPYFSTSQFPAANDHGIAAFPSIAPKTPEEPVVVINAKLATAGGPLPGSGTVNIQGFCINTNLTIAYLVDVRSQATGGGIHRYNGTGTGLPGSWTYAYTITNDVSVLPNVIFFMHIVADFSGANPILYATGGAVQGTTADASATNLVSTIDTGISNPTFTFLAASDPGTAFRGLTFAPNPVSLSIVKSGSNIIISWKGGGSLLSSSVVTGPFLPVAGSPTSPYTNAISGTAQFYGVGFP